jgi:ferredoxin-NADP reductase
MRGYFEIILKRGTNGDYENFVKAFDGLSVGDEIAIKAGKFRLNYNGDDDPIKYLTVIASGLGIAPALQLLKTTLADAQSTVEEVDFLWVNEHSREFVCEDNLDSLEVSYQKLSCTRLVEYDLAGRDYTTVDNILAAISAYETGHLVVVCAPPLIARNFYELFSKIGYPKQNILTIDSSV